MDHGNDDDIVPITEWPVISRSRSSDSPIDLTVKKSNGRVALDESNSHTHSPVPQASEIEAPIVNPPKRLKFRLRSPTRDRFTNQQTGSSLQSKLTVQPKTDHVAHFENEDCPSLRATKNEKPSTTTEPTAQVRIARWFRKNKHFYGESLSAGGNPNTTLFSISRNEECINFLKKEKAKLCEKACLPSSSNCATLHAAIASIDDYLGNYHSALERISHAIEIDSENVEHKWLQKKLQRQCKMIDIQKEKMELLALSSQPYDVPSMNEVDRISAKGLDPQQFWNAYVKKKKPVILMDAVKEMTTEQWDFEYVKHVAGSQKVKVKHSVPNSVEWARLEESRETSVSDFIDQLQKEGTGDYLFDWSLPIHCPDLAKKLTIPQYFAGNYLLQTSAGSLYRDSWPSLFIAPTGAVSDLHIDAFASNFWMALFQGQKRWTFFDADDTALLYPKYVNSMDPVFSVNISKPDLTKFPLFSLTKPKQCILQPGELLFVPAGSPHYVENLTTSLAVSSNHVDQSNYEQVCEELRVNALLDPRATDLLQQLENPNFPVFQTLPASGHDS